MRSVDWIIYYKLGHATFGAFHRVGLKLTRTLRQLSSSKDFEKMYHVQVEKPVEYLPSSIPIEMEKLDKFFFGNESDREDVPFAEVARKKTETSWSSEVLSHLFVLIPTPQM